MLARLLKELSEMSKRHKRAKRMRKAEEARAKTAAKKAINNVTIVHKVRPSVKNVVHTPAPSDAPHRWAPNRALMGGKAAELEPDAPMFYRQIDDMKVVLNDKENELIFRIWDRNNRYHEIKWELGSEIEKEAAKLICKGA